jgi:hypothetical protein
MALAELIQRFKDTTAPMLNPEDTNVQQYFAYFVGVEPSNLTFDMLTDSKHIESFKVWMKNSPDDAGNKWINGGSMGNVPQVAVTGDFTKGAQTMGNPLLSSGVVSEVLKNVQAGSATTTDTTKYQNPGKFDSLSVNYLGNTSISVLQAMAPIGKRAGFMNVAEEHKLEVAQSEAERKANLGKILGMVSYAAMFIPKVGPIAAGALGAASQMV